MQIGSKRTAEPLMLGGSKRLSIEEYADFDNPISNQLQPYSGGNNGGGGGDQQLLSQTSNEYFDLQLADPEEKGPVVNKIQRSLSRQQSTLRYELKYFK